MSDFQAFATQRLAALTAEINAIKTNGKKIDELPEQLVLNPISRLHVSREGISERISIQSIISAIVDNAYNQIILIGEITLDENVLTIPSGAQWKISNVIYGTITDTVITVPYSAEGLIRTDILVANTSGEIVLEQGTETAGIAVRPNIPIDTILVTEINVTEDTIGSPTDPITGDAYRKKLEKSEKLIYSDNSVTDLDIAERASYRLMGSMELINGINNADPYPLYDGREFTFKNAQSIPVSLVHNSGSTDYQFSLPGNENLILYPGDMCKVKFSKVAGSKLELVSTNQVKRLAPANVFKFIQKGFGNTDDFTYEIGDHFCGHSNDGTIRYSDAIWLGGALDDSENFKPLVQTEIS